MYIKPTISTFNEETLKKSILAFASCGATYCAIGTAWGSTCGSASSYCPSNASYSPDTGFCPSGGNYTICPSGSAYTGSYNL